MTETKFGADEEKMIYFFLLSSLRKEHFAAVGIEGEHSPYLSNEDKTNIVANLTPKAKAVIRRDFLIENFKNAYGSNAIADMLLEFAGKHMPERLADIENGHNEVYEKDISASKKRKPSFWCRSRPNRKRSRLKPMRTTKNNLNPKRLLLDHNS